MSSTALLRIPRSLGIAAAIFSLAAGAHVLGGGLLPSLGILAALGVAILVPIAALSGRRFSFPLLIALTGAGQVILHSCFTALSLPGQCLPAVAVGSRHHEPVTCAGPSTAIPAHAVEHPSALMVTAHLAAVLATALLLAKGDEALFRIRQWLAPLLSILRTPVLPTDSPKLTIWKAPLVRRRARRMYHYELRGPPPPWRPATAFA